MMLSMSHNGSNYYTSKNKVLIATFILLLISLAIYSSSLRQSNSIMSVVHDDVSPLSTAYNSERKLVINSRGDIYVPFTTNNKQNSTVHLAVSRDGGRSWIDLGQIPSNHSSSRVSMAVDREDILHIVWTEGIGDKSQIFYAKYDGGKWSSVARVSDTPWYSGYPSLAVDSKGFIHVVWYGFDGENYRIFYSNNTNGKWSQPLKISQGTFDSVNPSIAVDSDDNLHVVWYMKISSYYQIWYRERSRTWQEPILISPNNSDSSSPVIAVGNDGSVHIAWVRYTEGLTQIFYAVKKSGIWSKAVQISNGTNFAESPTLTLDKNNNPIVIWATVDGHLYYRKYNTQWQPIHLLSSGPALYPNSRWSYYNDGSKEYVDLIWTRQISGTFEEVFTRFSLGG